MAVNRVILQHFSMRYDYMTPERPNIYEESAASARASWAAYRTSMQKEDKKDQDVAPSEEAELKIVMNVVDEVDESGEVGFQEEEETTTEEEPEEKEAEDDVFHGIAMQNALPSDEEFEQPEWRRRPGPDRRPEQRSYSEWKRQSPPEDHWRSRSSNSAEPQPTYSARRAAARNNYYHHQYNSNNNNRNNAYVNNSYKNYNNRKQQHANKETTFYRNGKDGGGNSGRWIIPDNFTSWRADPQQPRWTRFVSGQCSAGESGGSSTESSSPNETDSYIGLSPPNESLLMQRRLRKAAAIGGIPIVSQSG